MSALDSGIIGTRVVTDLESIARGRRAAWDLYQRRLPIQDAEREAGLTEADIWRFLGDESSAGAL